MSGIVSRLLNSEEPAVRYRALVGVVGADRESGEVRAAREAIRTSPRVSRLLSLRDEQGRLPGVYRKYTGAHWVLFVLAELGYPAGDPALVPIRDQVYEMWLDPRRTKERVVDRESKRYKSRPGVPVLDGRARRCASQEGNALYATLALGISDERAHQLAANLMRWQWPDGGWNCDRKTEARVSSFYESLAPMRALFSYGRAFANPDAIGAAERAAEVFLSRRLFRRRRDGAIMNEDFVKLHYPCYWQYDILYGLRAMAEAGFIADRRCAEALDLLESKRLPDGGFPAERRHYRVVEEPQSGGSLVDWGGTGRNRSNEFVSVWALSVLQAAGRLG